MTRVGGIGNDESINCRHNYQFARFVRLIRPMELPRQDLVQVNSDAFFQRRVVCGINTAEPKFARFNFVLINGVQN
jgi:hypothetical protein